MNKAFLQKNIILIILALIVTSILIISRFGFMAAFFAAISLYAAIFTYIARLYEQYQNSSALKFIKSLMVIAVAVWLITFVIVEGAVIAKGRANAVPKGDYVLVLGAGRKGEVPSISLKSRLDKTSEYLKQNKDTKVIVSGGQGEGESLTEAEAMKRYLINAGIAESRIIKEEKSTSTEENLKFSKSILEDLEKDQKYSLVLITSDFHAFRTEMLSKRVGLNIEVLPAKTPLYIYINYSIREYLAVIKTFVIDTIIGTDN